MHFEIAALILLAWGVPFRPQTTHPAIQQYLKQPGFVWKGERQGGFQFYWEANLENDKDMQSAKRNAEAARATVLRATKISAYPQVVYVFFVASTDRMQQLTGYRGEGRARPAQHAIFFVPTPIRPDLTHELCHEILTNAWGAAEAWIEEGFATLLAEPDAVDLNCRSLMVQGRLRPLSELVRPKWDPTQGAPEITYRELGGFVGYLLQTYGLKKVRQIWHRGSASAPGIIGKSLTALEGEWFSELKQREGLQ